MRTVWFIWVPLAVAPLWQRLHVCQKMCELWGWRTWQVSGQEGCHVPSVPSLMWDSKDNEVIVCTLLNRAPFCHNSNPHHGHRVARNARRDEAHANVVRKESGRDGRGDAERPEEESWRGAAFTLRAACDVLTVSKFVSLVVGTGERRVHAPCQRRYATVERQATCDRRRSQPQGQPPKPTTT